jgi:hypothetical protein
VLLNRFDLLWASFVLLCLGSLVAYQGQAGRAAQAPSHWPAGLERGPRFTLVLFAHPRCPCTRATLRQIERLSPELRDELKTLVLFVNPPKTAADFHLANLWEQSKALASVTTLCDRDGRWARAFGCYTSGQALLYGPDGKLRFAGGLTPSRGHEGESMGLEAIEQHLTPVAQRAGVGAPTRSSEVYGCSLSSEGDPFCHP